MNGRKEGHTEHDVHFCSLRNRGWAWTRHQRRAGQGGAASPFRGCRVLLQLCCGLFMPTIIFEIQNMTGLKCEKELIQMFDACSVRSLWEDEQTPDEHTHVTEHILNIQPVTVNKYLMQDILVIHEGKKSIKWTLLWWCSTGFRCFTYHDKLSSFLSGWLCLFVYLPGNQAGRPGNDNILPDMCRHMRQVFSLPSQFQ